MQPGANLQKFAEPRVLASDWSRKSRDRCTHQCWPLIGRLVSGQKCTLQNETAGLKTFKAISSVYQCGISTKSCVSSCPGLCAVLSVQLRGLTLPLFARSTTCRFSDVSVARSNSNIHTAHFLIFFYPFYLQSVKAPRKLRCNCTIHAENIFGVFSSPSGSCLNRTNTYKLLVLFAIHRKTESKV